MEFVKQPNRLHCCEKKDLSLADWTRDGYFPNGLPPAFTSTFFAKEIDEIIQAWENNCCGMPTTQKKAEKNATEERKKLHKILYENRKIRYTSRPTHYSIPKRIYNKSRRSSYLPNPVHQAYLMMYMCDEWDVIARQIDSSHISLSKPILGRTPENRRRKRKRYLEQVKLHKDLDDYKISYSSYNRFALHVDLQGFYPSIYTHSIEWAMVGKDPVKSKRTYDKQIPRSLKEAQRVGDGLDVRVRNTQEAETRGVLIGSDTSFVLAEIVASRVDVEIQDKLSELDVVGYRHVDDMVFYSYNRERLSQVLEILRSALKRYNLTINENKTKIVELPEDYKPLWTSRLSSFQLKPDFESLRQFFTLAFHMQQADPNAFVLRYALQIVRPFTKKKNLSDVELEDVKRQHREWHFLESALSQALIMRPDNVVYIHDILVWYKRTGFVVSNFEKALHNFLLDVPIEHDFEIAWGLWLAQALDVKLESDVGKKVTKTDSPIIKLIALDLQNAGKICGLNDEVWKNELQQRSDESEEDWLIRLFYGSDWILAYESCMYGWLGLSKAVAEKDMYIKELSNRDVHFFVKDRQLEQPEIDRGLSYLGVGGFVGDLSYS